MAPLDQARMAIARSPSLPAICAYEEPLVIREAAGLVFNNGGYWVRRIEITWGGISSAVEWDAALPVNYIDREFEPCLQAMLAARQVSEAGGTKDGTPQDQA